MGYDMSINVFKNKTLNEAKKIFPDKSFCNLYEDFIFTRLYPDEYEFPSDERGRTIAYLGSIDILSDFYNFYFQKNLTELTDSAIVVDKDTYGKMLYWLENKLKHASLLDICNGKIDENIANAWVCLYKDLKKENINFETEFVVLEYSW